MTLMAGFDLVIEISNETIRKQLEQNLQLAPGVSARPPFEIEVPISVSGVNGAAHIIVNELQVDLNADDMITVTLSFDRSSVITTAPVSSTVCPLTGNFAITAPLQGNVLIGPAGAFQQWSINLEAANVKIDWPVNQQISEPATKAAVSFVRNLESPVLASFPIKPNENGFLVPFLQFERFEVHCIPNAERSKQALGIFGILLAVNDANGDPNQKTSTAITAANDGLCLSISPQVFHSLFFCPAVATALGVAANNMQKLPKTCGSSGGFETNGVTINSIVDSFGDNHINIDGSVSKSGFCYHANGTFHGKIELSITAEGLTPTVTMDKPDINVTIDCWGAAVFVTVTGIGLALIILIEEIVENIATDMANDALSDSLNNSLQPVSIGLPGVSFNSVSITTEGLTLQGTVPSFTPLPATPELRLNGPVVTTDSKEVQSGDVELTVCADFGPKMYHYIVYSQHQTVAYQTIGTLITRPFTPRYEVSVDNGIHWTSLTGASGTTTFITLDPVITYYQSMGGFTSMQLKHRISYLISDTTIQLTNEPEDGDYAKDGSYGFRLRVTVTDCTGKPIQDATGKLLSHGATVWFEGQHLDNGGYFQDSILCKNLQTKPPSGPPRPIPEPDPSEERLVKFIRDVLALNIPQVDEILLISSIAYGNRFLRAIESRVAQQPRLVRANVPPVANQQQLASTAFELMNLGQRLLSAANVSERTEIRTKDRRS